MSNQPVIPGQQTAAMKRLFAQLTSFFTPAAESAGLKLRPFSIATFTAMQCAGIAVGSSQFSELSEEQRTNQLYALLVIQTAPLGDLKKALRQYAGDFDSFFWEFVFERTSEIPIEALLALEEQLTSEMPAIEAAQVEVSAPEALSGGKEEKPPGN